jgi:hypothetical protein
VTDVAVRYASSTGTENRVTFLVLAGSVQPPVRLYGAEGLGWTTDASGGKPVIPDLPSESVAGVGPTRSFQELRMAVLDFIKANPASDEIDIAGELGISLKLTCEVYDSLLDDGFIVRV